MCTTETATKEIKKTSCSVGVRTRTFPFGQGFGNTQTPYRKAFGH